MGLRCELVVYPGHSEETTIGREWDENPFVRVWRGVEPEAQALPRRRGRGDPRRLEQRLRRRRQGLGALSATTATRSSAAPGGQVARGLHRLRGDRALRRGTRRRPRSFCAGSKRRRARRSLPADAHGAVAGRLLEFLVLLRPQRVLELRTYSGYSTLAMASVLPPERAHRHLRVEETHAAVARRYLDEAGAATASRSTSALPSRLSRGWRASSTSSSSTPTRPTTLPTTKRSCRACRRTA